ncbi:hypothetical protein CP967_26585 [Streptomyces nitrosporeus]|uniref:Uncharacterized protein n=1 Tax=Streptomyces nitrosporeus TaxID=28894 RepID=A0A5J6FF67_9ACTN|nr:hypothetical protein CP967_26585 [Streptomyces nitrosporeus]
MSERHTCPSAPVALPLRLDVEPKPVPGCAHCGTGAMDRDHAKANGDASRVSDRNVRMSRHLADAQR